MITNDIDQCPNTPVGVVVDSSGCPQSLSTKDLFDSKEAIKLFPNPVKEMLYIEVNSPFDASEFYNIKIYNFNSSLVYDSTKFEEKIDLKNFNSGIYFVQIMTKDYQRIQKIIIE